LVTFLSRNYKQRASRTSENAGKWIVETDALLWTPEGEIVIFPPFAMILASSRRQGGETMPNDIAVLILYGLSWIGLPAIALPPWVIPSTGVSYLDDHFVTSAVFPRTLVTSRIASRADVVTEEDGLQSTFALPKSDFRLANVTRPALDDVNALIENLFRHVDLIVEERRLGFIRGCLICNDAEGGKSSFFVRRSQLHGGADQLFRFWGSMSLMDSLQSKGPLQYLAEEYSRSFAERLCLQSIEAKEYSSIKEFLADEPANKYFDYLNENARLAYVLEKAKRSRRRGRSFKHSNHYPEWCEYRRGIWGFPASFESMGFEDERDDGIFSAYLWEYDETQILRTEYSELERPTWIESPPGSLMPGR
jgi:hypothetical protein